MKRCIINHRRYEVTYVFNMVGNYYFTDKDNVAHLVDASDVTEWLIKQHRVFKNGIDAAIAYAKQYVMDETDGIFWWKAEEL